MNNTNEHNSSHVARRGLLLVLSSPSGAGKTTLARELLGVDPTVSMSVSATTRAPRPGEIDGKDYIFVSETAFQKMIDAGELLEWAKVFGNFYGTPKALVENAIASGRDVLFDIDWQGTQQLKEKMSSDLVPVFILPPSGEALETRLKSRNQDSDDVVAQRMAQASSELSHWPEYEYVIVNTDLSESLATLRSILSAERAKRERQLGLSKFVREMQVRL
ncbi:MAG: guanylate kinase [Hyphomicrobiaceae bacterium]